VYLIIGWEEVRDVIACKQGMQKNRSSLPP